MKFREYSQKHQILTDRYNDLVSQLEVHAKKNHNSAYRRTEKEIMKVEEQLQALDEQKAASQS